MILAIDVDYRENNYAVIAGVIFNNWKDKEPINTIVTDLDHIEDYVSGQFYKRELPCILKLLDEMQDIPKCIVVDGYVFLDENKKGLGAYLYEALDKEIAIIGVAKSAFKNISTDTYLYRGESHFTPQWLNLHFFQYLRNMRFRQTKILSNLNLLISIFVC